MALMKHKRTIMVAIGWLLVLAIVVLSLVPVSGMMPAVPSGDKYGHLLAYGVLMFWFGQLYNNSKHRWLYAFGFMLMGGVLEWLQGMTGFRQTELLDFLMNVLGVCLGLAAAYLIDLRRYFV
ncbi:VanZ family protein [Marinicella sp. W31]|uniref:VanZ family protein n=1 Tax=Marinicella sp. W31 TaxID=3023713 RepID=UPI003757B6E0